MRSILLLLSGMLIAAPVAAATMQACAGRLKIDMWQGYGMTEASVFICLQPDGQIKVDTVGPAAPGVEIRLADSGEVLYRWLRESGLLGELTRAGSPESDEKIRNIGRLFDIVRTRSRLLELDRAPFLVRYLEELGEAGDDPSAADVDPDIDAVALLTFLFLGGEKPGAPFPTCGFDPQTTLDCESYPACP